MSVMRFIHVLPCLVLCLALSATVGDPAFGQSVQAPPQRGSDPQPKALAPAPRTPVQQSGKTTAPVVQPHGTAHAQKPPPHNTRQLSKPVAPTPAPEPAAVLPAPPAETPPPDEKKPLKTKGPIPRFAALRFDDVNMRHGPGPRYEIDWVYKRRDLPVQIEREYDIWRLIRDPDGTRGWVSEASLTGRRTFIVTGADASLRKEAADTAAIVAVLKSGVIGRIRSCEAASDWCRVQAGEYRGYLKRSQFWGTMPSEVIAP